MLKTEFINDKYCILDENNNIIFSARLENTQIVLETKSEVYAGPIEFLTFSK